MKACIDIYMSISILALAISTYCIIYVKKAENKLDKSIKKGREMLRKLEDQEHLVCSSYPNCDLSPLGCIIRYPKNVERYGHKD